MWVSTLALFNAQDPMVHENSTVQKLCFACGVGRFVITCDISPECDVITLAMPVCVKLLYSSIVKVDGSFGIAAMCLVCTSSAVLLLSRFPPRVLRVRLATLPRTATEPAASAFCQSTPWSWPTCFPSSRQLWLALWRMCLLLSLVYTKPQAGVCVAQWPSTKHHPLVPNVNEPSSAPSACLSVTPLWRATGVYVTVSFARQYSTTPPAALHNLWRCLLHKRGRKVHGGRQFEFA